ncbi:MAG: ribosomal protein S18-alanine N-acetyltransferase [Acidobacteriales bacterium]|nr:ribosomal protein S18-alanine N-acetyltransferase [Candidatus Koribacter versatilis]MBI3644544.1 ribosomal protein S18-alanine N-acetyltransferase [Terriglobales bacterium]
MPVTIRSATLDDVPAILAIERQAASAAHWTVEQYARLVESGLVLVADEGSNVSGFICAKMLADEWEIENVVVAMQVRRQGTGDTLLRELLRQARSQGGSAVWLEVRESNQPARCLYEKHGFRESGRRRGYYREPIEDAVLYEWRVPSSE